MRVRASLVGVLGVALSLALAPGAGAAVVKVNCGAGGNLQSKLNSAPAGSTILIRGTCVGAFVVPKRLMLKGNPKATLDANDLGPVLNVQTSDPVRLENLKITDGASASGGGIMAAGGDSLTLVNVTVTGNRATINGGGIASNGPVILRNSTVSWNTVENTANGPTVQGGGIFASSVRLTNSTISSNKAHATGTTTLTYAYGGGIFVNGSVLVAARSHIDKNTARADGIAPTAWGGGAIQFLGPTPFRFTGGTLNGNAAIAVAPGGGASSAQGGAVSASSVVATGTSLVGNRLGVLAMTQAGTARGAALSVFNGATLTRVTIRNSVVGVESNLTATAEGGGVNVAQPDGKLTLKRSTISGTSLTALSNSNANANGGGALAHGPATVSGSTISGNTARSQSNAASAVTVGGGLRVDGKLTLQSSTVSGNTALAQVGDADSSALGGGVALTDGSDGSRIWNTTLTKNTARALAAATGTTPTATAQGGGLEATLTNVRLTNATVARNTVSGQALISFIRGGGLESSSSVVELRGTIVAGNTGPDGRDCAGPFASLGHNLISATAGCTFASKPNDKLTKPAKLGTFGLYGGPTRTIRLKSGSPALNAIRKSQCTVKRDQRGVKRPQQKRCEIGAWERKP